MNYLKILALFIVIAASAVLSDCSKESSKNVIPGYWSPGVFRPKGIAREKCFKLNAIEDNSTSPATVGKTCSSGTSIDDPSTTDPTKPESTGRCMAVYGVWLTGPSNLLSSNNYKDTFPTEGIALNDDYLAKTNMTLKMIRYPNSPWTLYLYINGVQYTKNNVTAIELVPCVSIDYTTPAYTKPDGEFLESSGVRLDLVFIRFLDDIVLTATAGNTQTIKKTGDLPDPAKLPTWIEEIPGTPPTYVQHYNLPATGDYILTQKYI